MNQEASAYDQSSTLYSPDGRLYQVEYARKAVDRGSTVAGLKGKDGVALIAYKRIFNRLIESSYLDKLYKITGGIGCATSGLVADSRILINYGREVAQNHSSRYGEEMATLDLTRSICRLMAVYSQYGGARPFGTSLIFAGEDDGELHLVHTDVSGIRIQHTFVALGTNSEAVTERVGTKYDQKKKLDKLVPEVIGSMAAELDEEFTPESLDIGVVRTGQGFRILTDDEVAEIISKV